MHTNVCKNKKLIFYKMVHDQIYHDLITPMLCWIKWLWNGLPILQPQGLWCGCKIGRSHFKMGRVVKQVGTVSLLCHQLTSSWVWVVNSPVWIRVGFMSWECHKSIINTFVMFWTLTNTYVTNLLAIDANIYNTKYAFDSLWDHHVLNLFMLWRYNTRINPCFFTLCHHKLAMPAASSSCN